MKYPRAFQHWWMNRMERHGDMHLENWQYERVKKQSLTAWEAGRKHQKEHIPTGTIDPIEITLRKGDGRDMLCDVLQMSLCALPIRIQPGTWHVTLRRLPKKKEE